MTDENTRGRALCGQERVRENVVNGAEIDRKPHSGNCSDERWQENHERQRSSQWNAGNSSFNS